MTDEELECWQRALALYDSLTGPDWAHIPKFRALVCAISGAPEARGLTAVTSHESLLVSPYARYPDWFEGRRVALYPLADGRVRVLSYGEGSARGEALTLPVGDALEDVLRRLAHL